MLCAQIDFSPRLELKPPTEIGRIHTGAGSLERDTNSFNGTSSLSRVSIIRFGTQRYLLNRSLWLYSKFHIKGYL